MQRTGRPCPRCWTTNFKSSISFGVSALIRNALSGRLMPLSPRRISPPAHARDRIFTVTRSRSMTSDDHAANSPSSNRCGSPQRTSANTSGKVQPMQAGVSTRPCPFDARRSAGLRIAVCSAKVWPLYRTIGCSRAANLPTATVLGLLLLEKTAAVSCPVRCSWSCTIRPRRHHRRHRRRAVRAVHRVQSSKSRGRRPTLIRFNQAPGTEGGSSAGNEGAARPPSDAASQTRAGAVVRPCSGVAAEVELFITAAP